MFASVGSIIGSGWLLGALSASKVAGPAALISWVIGAVVVAILALVHAELGGAFPVAGGSGRYPHYAFGSLAGLSSAWFWYLGAVTVAPAEVEAALSYANNYIPNLIDKNGALTVPEGFVIAAVLMALFTVINVLGVRWLARTNTIIVAWKIAVPVLTIIVFLGVFHHFENLTSHGFAPNGVSAIFAALSTGIIFAYLGFEQAVEFGAESTNPQRNIPLAVIGSVVIGVIVYLGLAITFATSFDPGALSKGWSNLSFTGSFGPYAAIAGAAGLGVVAFVLYVDAVVSPGGTGLLYVGSSARMSFGMARSKYIPGQFEGLSAQHVPLLSLVFAMVLGFIFFLPFPTWQGLISIITGATVLSYGLQPLALSALRRQAPDLARPYRLQLSEVIAPAAFIIANLIIYWGGWDTNKKLMVAVVLGFILLGLNYLLSPADRKPNLDWKAAYWIVPYLAGTTAISYIGAKDFGGIGVVPFGWDALVVGVFSLVIYVLAVNLRLPAEQAQRYIKELGAELEAEEELIAEPIGELA